MTSGSGDPRVVRGRPVGADEQARLETLRELASLEQSADRIKKYSEWIFGLGTTIALLATGLSTVFAKRFGEWSVLAFAVTVLAFGLSLVCSTLALRPRWESILSASPSSIDAALGRVLEIRRRWLALATSALLIAIGAAGSVPMLAFFETSPALGVGRAHLEYAVAGDTVRARLAGWRLDGHSPAKLSIYAWDDGTYRLLTEEGGAADSTGVLRIERTVADTILRRAPRVFITGEWQNQRDHSLVERRALTVDLPRR
jgi:hypothetical protein